MIFLLENVLVVKMIGEQCPPYTISKRGNVRDQLIKRTVLLKEYIHFLSCLMNKYNDLQ